VADRPQAQWRAAVIALQAAARVDAGDILAALDALAEALEIVEESIRNRALAPGRPVSDDPVIGAADAVAGVLLSLSLFEPAAALAAAAARTRPPPAGSTGGTLATALLVRRLAQVHVLWGAQLELLGLDDQAGTQHARSAGCAVRLRVLAAAVGNRTLQRCAAAVEAFALERLGEVELAQARAATALVAEPRPDGVLEWVPGRVALARCAAHGGDVDAAQGWLDSLADRVSGGGHDVWVPLMQVAAAEVASFADPDAAGHPSVEFWQDVAASATARVWAEREARFADLRHRILRRELAARGARTARELLVDPLTGVGNRRRLEHELATGPTGAVLFIDIDNFKRINDVCGHAAGDDVLRGLARILRACCRGGDVVVRYGGDEFVLVLRKASSAATVARRVLERVRSADWGLLTGGLPVTVSVGAAEGVEAGVALQRSDAAMLAAKRAGRDGLVLL
jgi:diguanylate cyclase (GGDEF)-like protein